jgi:hypothetical protein
MHIGMLGTMAQLYLSDLKQKTWRGQLGRALQGKVPGGKAYGYDLVTAATGERQINPVEAAIVSRIFTEFANGHSPRAIAKRLNAEGVPGPGGRPWGDTTIRGQAERGTGLLNNVPLRWAARVEPLQLRQGPPHRQACRPSQCPREVGDHRGAAAPHCR